jgi:ATP-dependent DNA ligase
MSVSLSISDLGAVQQGTGARDRRLYSSQPAGCVNFRLLRDKLIFLSKVRNGFVPRLRREVWSKLQQLQTDACPFANLPEKKRTQWALTREEMKNCVWLRPELVAQIQFTEWTPDGHLRHSKFYELREDKEPHNVVRE